MVKTYKYKKTDDTPSFAPIFDEYALSHNQPKEVVAQILKHYRIKDAKIKDDITNIANDLNLILAPNNLATREIATKELVGLQFNEPIIVFTKEKHTPLVIYPKENYRSYFVNPITHDRYIISSTMLPDLEEKAICFYHPLPSHKITFKDYLQYIKGRVKPIDWIIVLLMIAAVTAIGMFNPYLMKRLTGEVVENKDMQLFYVIALQMTGIYVGSLLLRTLQGIVNARVSIKTEHALHNALMQRLLSLPTTFFRRYNTGELSTRLNSISALYSLIIDGILITGVSALMSLVYIIQINTFASGLVLPTIGILIVNAFFLILTALVERGVLRRQMKAIAKERGVSYGLINGIQKIRLTGSEKEAYEKWEITYKALDKVKYHPPFIVKIAPIISVVITLIGNVLIYYLVAKNNIDTSSYVAFLSSFGILAGALLQSSRVVGNVTRIRPLREMIAPILEAETENHGDKIKVDEISGHIKIDNVTFRYKDDEPEILKDFSLDIKEGEYVAIVGKTGCGKSTIIRLLLGLETPNKGTIYYDDHDMIDLNLQSLRKRIGSVTQNGMLFHADIFSNIIITAPDKTEEDVWEAAKIACIDEDIREMPMGLRTIISEGQGGISGGQKQRLMIARAIINKPKVLIFDEATSSLDNEAQKTISDSIAKLNCTRIVVAHRLSTIQDCDRILYLEDGKILEEGTYQELIKLNGKFKTLVEKQRI